MLPSECRENQAVSHPEKRPTWISPDQYKAFSGIRAHPRSQFRCILDAISLNLLPFGEVCVHVLLRQSLYQFGHASWKLDIEGEWRGVDVLTRELEYKLTLLTQTPSHWSQVQLFGCICAFFGQVHPKCRSLCLEFSTALLRLATETEKQQGASEAMEVELYQKLGRLYGGAILCHPVGTREATELKHLMQLSILVKKAWLFEKAAASISSNTDKCFESVVEPFVQAMIAIMSIRIQPLLDFVTKNTEFLTECLALIVDDAPSDLHWTNISIQGIDRFTCFEAVHRHDLYSINILNGTVLVNGASPGLLSVSITADPLYLRTFGDVNFEVVPKGFRKYQTSRAVNGSFFYEFFIDTNDQLHITELQYLAGQRLRLIPRKDMDLPIRIRELHSHWMAEDLEVIVVRGPTYREMRIQFLVTQSKTYVVPFGSQGKDIETLCKMVVNFETVHIGTTNTLKVLERFECHDYIHIFVDASQRLVKYLMPRYSLTFHQDNQRTQCIQFSGCHLSPEQGLADTLPGLDQTLMLENEDKALTVLIPDGNVETRAKITVPARLDFASRYRIYSKHKRLKLLECNDVEGWLHMAALFASNASLMLLSGLGRSGFQQSIDVLRYCWQNEPFSRTEKAKLEEVRKHGKLCCTLLLVCECLHRSSERLHFLHNRSAEQDDVDETPIVVSQLDRLALQEYDVKVLQGYGGCTLPKLTHYETLELYGALARAPCSIGPFLVRETKEQTFVQDSETLLLSQLVARKRKFAPFPLRTGGKMSPHEALSQLVEKFTPFPLRTGGKMSPYEAKIITDLKESYFLHLQEPVCCLPKDRCEYEALVTSLRAETTLRRKSIENTVLASLTSTTPTERLCHYSGGSMSPTAQDLLLILTDPQWLHNLYRHLDSIDFNVLVSDVTDWAILCVFEDKMSRIARLDAFKEERAVVEELKCTRTWQPRKHSRWLAFEVEQRLQIRPYQYLVVEQLLDQPGSMLQLNMGLGKTRVLVPMLVMEWLSQPFLTRLNVLPSILHEAIAYYRKTFVASLQAIRVYTMPFDRGVLLNDATEMALSHCLDECNVQNGFLVVAPRHRNSLLLKQYDHGIMVKGLKSTIRDIIDESDAILSYDFQLVYAIGGQVRLPNGNSRWHAAEALLWILSTSDVAVGLDPQVTHRQSFKRGCFSCLRFLKPFFEDARFKRTMDHNLCCHLLQTPPYEFRWMRLIGEEAKEDFIKLICVAETDAMALIKRHSLFEQYCHDILSFRGFIAYGLLCHGLARRHRVDYGLAEAHKLLAVPFSASDTPKERSEFSHPDMAILYTTISYLSTGLTKQQFYDALKLLKKQGRSTQQTIFQRWIDSVRDSFSEDVVNGFDDIEKVDLSNNTQLSLMHQYLGASMLPIFYWLNHFVFPTETNQFPQKRSTSAWHLVDQESRGFSGTDDTKDLLPLAVKQQAPQSDALRGTNGMMIDLIISHCTKKEVLILNEDGKLWKNVLDACHVAEADALIDVGGAMAGVANAGDSSKSRWHVSEFESRRDLPLQTSSLKESECFVYFDESRCRGADLKLKFDAHALVTLASNLTKDKFLQGCARLRRLGKGQQSIVLAGTSEVVTRSSTVKDVLEKIVQNTVGLTRRALPLYLDHGLDYLKFPDPIEIPLLLEKMYGSPFYEQRGFLDHLNEIVETHVDLTNGKEENRDHLLSYCSGIGNGLVVQTSGANQECERELEEEIEEEQQQEIEVPEQVSYRQISWDFSRSFERGFRSLFGDVFLPLKSFVDDNIPGLQLVEWSQNLFCTQNFWRTVQDMSRIPDSSLYLRLVNAFLVFKDGRTVLVSLFELDQLLPHWWTVGNQFLSPSPSSIQQLSRVLAPHLGSLGGRIYPLPTEVLTSIKLFCGIVDYDEEERRCLTQMFQQVRHVRPTIEKILTARHQMLHFERSDLEDFCDTFGRRVE